MNKPELGGTMSEEQVLPELDLTREDKSTARKLLHRMAVSENNLLNALETVEARERQLLTALASLAQSEAERDRLLHEIDLRVEQGRALNEDKEIFKRELARERELHRWRDVKQELPEYGQLCILFGSGVVQHALYSLDDESGNWQPFDEDFDAAPFSTFTHWQPLPQPSALLEDKSKPVATTSKRESK